MRWCTLDIQDGSSVAVCSSCGTKQTIPKLDNETRVNLYDRANHFRRNNDYDKAMSIYEQLLAADKTDAEAYWSIVLCKYGIEYVEDPKTRKMVPTINRAQYTSIFADEDYKSALRYADGYQRTIYETEAKELDKIQKGILAISQKEEPFDVFICYKETDSYGRRTHDSVLAQDLYFQLKQEGFKVFFSRITLEDKLGVAYEPYIFAALNTAKVMVVVGTSKENLNAVWVKNEWSRFLALIKKDSSKVLIPAYRDMDPYDLPEEFSHLQAQDMSKLGFMQDLIRGIKKLARPTKTQQTVVVEKVGATPANTDALIKRAFLFLEDGDWTTANKYAERVLDNNPECSKAYLVKLLAELNIRKPELLSKFNKNLLDYSNFKKAVRFADSSEREVLANYNKDVANNIKQAANERVYSVALKRVAVPSNEKDLKQSIADLRLISGYKDADAKTVELEKRLENFLKKKRETEEKARIKAEEEKIRQERLAEEERAKARKRKKIRLIVVSVLVFVIVMSVLIAEVFVPMGQIDKADQLFREGKIEDAMAIYKEQYDTDEGETKYKTAKAVQSLASISATQGSYYSNIHTILSCGAEVKINYSHDTFEEDITGQKEDQWFVYQSKGSWEVDGLPTPVNPGYYFVSWKFVGYGMDNKDRLELTFKPLWTPVRYSIIYNLDGGKNASKNPSTYTIETESFMISNPTREGYIFEGWTSSTVSTPTKGVIIEQGTIGNITLIAHWKQCPVTLEKNISVAGTVSGLDGTIEIGKETTITAQTNPGYTWLGWYDGDTLLTTNMSYTFTMPAEETTYTAKWAKVTLEKSPSAAGSVSSLKGTYKVGDSVTVTATTNSGYVWLGWYDGETLLTTDLSYTFTMPAGNMTYTAKWIPCSVTLEKNISAAGSVSSLTGMYKLGESVTITATTNPGYTWLGWYDGDTLLTTDLSYTFSMPAEEKTYIAKWAEYYVTAEKNMNDAGSCGIAGSNYSITFNLNGGTGTKPATQIGGTATYPTTIPTRDGYVFAGWYDNQSCTGSPYDFTQDVAENITLYAKWIFYSGEGVLSLNSSQSIYVYLYSSMEEYYAFVPLTDGQITVYTTGSLDTKGYLCDSNKTQLIHNGDGGDGYNFSITYNVTAGTLYYIWPYITYGSSGKTTIHLEGALPEDGGTILESANERVPAGETVELVATTNPGYVWLGWYDGDTKVSDDLTYTFTMPAESKTYTAKWTISDEMSNFNFIASSDGFTITGIKDKTVTSIDVPDYVTEISAGAFSGCSSLESLTIPFVGAKAGVTSSDTYQYPFGYIFGTTSYTGGTGVKQYYYGSSTSSTTGTTFYIPSSLRSVTVTGENILYGAFMNCSKLSSIIIPDSVTSIGELAFGNCSGLTSITIPDSVTSIGGQAFQECDNLTSIAIPNTVANISSYAFSGCTSLTSVTFGENSQLTIIGAGAFGYCSGLTVVTIPDSVTFISNNAFVSCSSLISVVIPNSVTSIGYTTFGNCSSLTNVYYCGTESEWATINFASSELTGATRYYYSECIHDSNHWRYDSDGNISSELTVGDGIVDVEATCTTNGSRHKECTICHTTLETDVIPAGHTESEWIVDVSGTCTVDGRKHKECTVCHETLETETKVATGHDYAEIVVLPTATEQGHTLHQCLNCEENYKDNYVDALGYAEGLAYSVNADGETCTITGIGSCTKTGMAIPEEISGYAVTAIGDGAFKDYNSLTRVVIPDCVTSIGERAFEGCANLTSITIPDGVISIGDAAFEYCTGLTSIIIPDSVMSIGDGAFKGCSSLESITIPFVGAKAGVTSNDTYQYPFGYIFGSWGYVGETSVVQYYYGSSTTSKTSMAFYIPESLHSVTVTGGNILCGAFYNCSMLTNITISDSVTSIGNDAFEGCTGLTGITIPNSVISIGNNAFYRCSNLTSITIPDSVTSIGEYAFYGCSNLTSITFSGNSQLTSFGNHVFENCTSLTNMTIPDSVTSIGSYAFEFCNSLTSVTFKDPKGWYVATSAGATSGTSLTLTDASTNATYLEETFEDYYWYKV